MSILWLASWYPSEFAPFDGDFIQRHARALAQYRPVTVIHFVQENDMGIDDKMTVTQTANLTEIIVCTSFKKSGIPIIDKIGYNLKFILCYQKVIREYLEKNNKPNLIHVHIPMKAGLIAVWIKRKYKIPYIITEHYDIYNNLLKDSFIYKSAVYKYFTRLIFKKALLFLSVSKQVGENICNLVTRKPYTVIYNTVDTSLFFYSVQHNHQEKFRFIHVSTMVPRKNTKGIIEVFQQLYKKKNSCELFLVGPYDESLYAIATSMSLLNNAIYFLGEVPYPEVAVQIRKAHSLILFSVTENMPCVMLEALCCGLPVIATNVGGIPEIIDETNGILVPAGDKNALLGAMDKMITDYTAFNRVKIAEKAGKEFSYETIGSALNDLYADLAE